MAHLHEKLSAGCSVEHVVAELRPGRPSRVNPLLLQCATAREVNRPPWTRRWSRDYTIICDASEAASLSKSGSATGIRTLHARAISHPRLR